MKWCSSEPKSHSEVGGHASADITIHELSAPPPWMMRKPDPACTEPDCGCGCHSEETR